MASSNTRGNRRRWMLHEDVRAGIVAVDEETLDSEGSAKRYAFDGQSASYAIATRLLPQSLLSITGLLVVGMVLAAGLASADRHSTAIGQTLGIESLPAVEIASPKSIVSWISQVSLSVATLLCLLIYGLRRHRLDDFRGKYRRWLAAAATCGLASLMLSTGLHHSLAQAAAAASGFSAFPNHAFWWVVPAALVVGWVSIRVALDMRPCRLGLFSLAIAAALYLTTLAGHFDQVPTAISQFASPSIALYTAHLWLIVALLAQVRFILLEASGAIASTSKPEKASSLDQAFSENSKIEAPEKAESPSSWSAQTSTPARAARPAPEPRKTSTSSPPRKSLIAASKGETQWIDGRNSRDADDDDEQEGRPLSKAEKKRLRREQARRAA